MIPPIRHPALKAKGSAAPLVEVEPTIAGITDHNHGAMSIRAAARMFLRPSEDVSLSRIYGLKKDGLRLLAASDATLVTTMVFGGRNQSREFNRAIPR